MSNKHTIKALEELVKTEHMSVAALDSALAEVHDNKTRRQYRKWRDSHVKQGNALNNRLEDLGGDPVDYDNVGSGKTQATLWGKITGARDDTSIAGMRLGAERGIKRYIDHLDEIDDPKALSIIRKNLEAKQDEIKWYDDQATKERTHKVETHLDVSQEKAKDLAIQTSNGKGGGFSFPFPLLLIVAAIGAAAFFFLRRGEESDYDDYGEDAFRYEGEGENVAGSFGSSSGLSSQGNGAGTSDYDSGMAASGDQSNPS